MSTWKATSTNVPKLKKTHFLRIPLATAISTPQLQKSLQQVAADRLAVKRPHIAWSSPEEMSLVLGSLVLDTPARVRKAERVLHSIDMTGLVNHCMADLSSLPQSPTKVNPEDPERLPPVQVPVVSLHGLSSNDRMLKRATSLKAIVQEPRPFLSEFRRRVCDRFVAERLMARDELKPFRPKARLMARLMSTNGRRTENLRKIGKRGWLPQPVMDASGIFPKYKDFPWTADFPLERLCISEKELKDVTRDGEIMWTGYRDIASICFPAFHEDQVATEQEGDVYTAAAQLQARYQIIKHI
ncbi:MAG: hypothetical protein LQ352_008388, partial [Teloschistes flavicans]